MEGEGSKDLKCIDYGVCDSPEQLASKFPKFRGLVWITVVRRSNEPKDGGWRWRKWGTYVGNYTVDRRYNDEWVEYLSQCDGRNGRQLIDEQYVFSVRKPENNVMGLDAYQAYMLFDGKVEKTDEYVEDHPLIAFMRTAAK